MEEVKIIDGILEITKSEIAVTRMTKDEVIDKKAEAQTTVDHLQLDLDAAKTEVAKWDNYLIELSKLYPVTK